MTSTLINLNRPVDIEDCQAADTNMDVLFVNGSQGTVTVPVTSTISTGIQRTRAGNGTFVYHLNAGPPTKNTLTALFDLGTSCFPFVNGSPVVVENNAGRTNLVGASNYFGSPISDPAKAPVFVSPTQVAIDTGNLPSGSNFTAQSVQVNAAASSKKGASLSNAVLLVLQ